MEYTHENMFSVMQENSPLYGGLFVLDYGARNARLIEKSPADITRKCL